MHLGLALGKKTIALFGPTPYQEIEFYGLGEAILPEPAPDCMPCFEGKCEKREISCIEDINPERVAAKVKQYLGER
jgi:heptosyltransferase-2